MLPRHTYPWIYGYIHTYRYMQNRLAVKKPGMYLVMMNASLHSRFKATEYCILRRISPRIPYESLRTRICFRGMHMHVVARLVDAFGV